MKKEPFWYYFWIIFIAIHVLLYFLTDGMDIRLAVLSSTLGLFLSFLRGQLNKRSYYIVAGCCTLIALGIFVYIIVSR
ncbi:MAG TPA: hypothetical protein VKZ57_10175 [Sphingobacterium sp.]|nr:hypothetical protein [Sphingobacterium sp.]